MGCRRWLSRCWQPPSSAALQKASSCRSSRRFASLAQPALSATKPSLPLHAVFPAEWTWAMHSVADLLVQGCVSSPKSLLLQLHNCEQHLHCPMLSGSAMVHMSGLACLTAGQAWTLSFSCHSSTSLICSASSAYLCLWQCHSGVFTSCQLDLVQDVTPSHHAQLLRALPAGDSSDA